MGGGRLSERRRADLCVRGRHCGAGDRAVGAGQEDRSRGARARRDGNVCGPAAFGTHRRGERACGNACGGDRRNAGDHDRDRRERALCGRCVRKEQPPVHHRYGALQGGLRGAACGRAGGLFVRSAGFGDASRGTHNRSRAARRLRFRGKQSAVSEDAPFDPAALCARRRLQTRQGRGGAGRLHPPESRGARRSA